MEDLKLAFKNLDGKVAAIVMEPMWLDFPNETYLHEVKEIAHKNGALLIFDEVLTGFRLANGGGQELLKIEADLAAFGKSIGNGMPLGAITGKEEYMKKFNDIFYSTTYGGETLSLAAGMAVIDEYLTKDVILQCWKNGQMLKDGLNKLGNDVGLDFSWNGTPVRGSITFSDKYEYSPKLLRSIFLQECITNGVLFGPGETLISYSHSVDDVKTTLNVCEQVIKKIDSGIKNKTIHELLKGKETQTVMTF